MFESTKLEFKPAAMGAELTRRGQQMPRAGLSSSCVAVLVACAAIFPGPALAWENDVHEGLTRWLAESVGFTPQEAGWIASGDQGVDDSNVTGPVLSTAISSCVATDASGSATVARNHFPSRVLAPADAASRVVAKGEPWWETHRASPPTVDGSEPTLLSLGRYLHSLQDSWSHQGMPDIPLSCDPKYAWGHSLERGGWSCHLADLTYKWADRDVMPMARATYDALVSAYGRKPKHTWDELNDQVSDFARLDNKSGKAKWLQQRRIPNSQDVAFATSLKNCPSGQPRCVFDNAYEEARKHWDEKTSRLAPLPRELPKEVTLLLAKFGEAMTSGDEKTLRSLIDQELAQIAIERALRINSSCASLYEEEFKWSLLDPFMTAKGAQQPGSVCELAMRIQSTEGPGVACTETTSAAIRAHGEASARGPDLKRLIDKLGSTLRSRFAFSNARRARDNEKGADYWANGYFPHLPKDRLLLGVSRRGDSFKVTTFIWQPDE